MRIVERSVRFMAIASLLSASLLAGLGPSATSAASPRPSPAAHPVQPAGTGDIGGIDITLPLGQTISGTVTDGSALPIADMTVQACSSDLECHTTTTAADGSYTVEGLAPDSYLVNVFALDTLDFLDSWYTPGGAAPDDSTAVQVDVTTTNATGIDITPLSGYSISGTVTGLGAGALAGVQVFANGSTTGSSATTDGAGHYTVHHLPNGTYRLGEYMAAGLNFVSGNLNSGTVVQTIGSPVVVSSADLAGQDFSVPAGLRVSGTLTGAEASGGQAQVFGMGQGGQATIAPNGTWQVVGLLPGTYQLLFLPAELGIDSSFPFGYWNGTATLTPNAAQATNIVLTSTDRTGLNAAIPSGATVSGSVVGSDGPIGAGSIVEMCGPGGVGCGETSTGAGGTWSLHHVPAATYHVQAFEHAHDGGYFGPGGYAVDVAHATAISVANASKSGVNIVLPAGLGISGLVSGPSAESVAGAHVDEFPGGVSPAGDGTAQTALDGTFRVAGRPGGDYGLFVGLEDPTPYLTGYYDAAAPGHFTLDANLATSISLDDGVGSSYVPITPVRVVDSRTGLGVPEPFRASVPQAFTVGGFIDQGGLEIPSDATAVTGNVTVDGQTAAGSVSITPTAEPNPATSTLNFPIGDIRANNFTTALAPDGRLAAVYKASAGKHANVIVDITGYFKAGNANATYTPIVPVRILDSRPVNNVGLAGKFKANVPRTLTVAGVLGLPGNVTAISANLTVVNQTSAGDLAVTPTAMVNPHTSTLNFPKGDIRANGLTVALSGTSIAIVYKAPSGTADVVLDVTGYYQAGSGGLLFYPLPPGRLLDTRSGVLASALTGAFTSSVPRTMATTGRAGVPLGAAAVTGNLTVVGQTGAGSASLTETPAASPGTSTLNFPLGDTRANGVTAPLSPGGELSLVYKSGTAKKTQFVLDLTGYFR